MNYLWRRIADLDATVWFTDDICTRCHEPVTTDGKTIWCSDGCILNAKPVQRDEFGFISDLIR